VWLPPSQYEAAFVSTCIGEAEIAFLLEAAAEALKAVAK
jgi:glutamate-1-semialdehyde 2,1-aminomutase